MPKPTSSCLPPLVADQALDGAAAFRPESLSAETADFNQRLESLLAKLPLASTLPPEVSRQAREAGRGPFGALVLSRLATVREIAGPGGPLPLRILRPPTVRAIYLHLHGGGWVFGRPHHYDQLNERVAEHCEVAVVSVDYRLAPEHPHPAALDDCVAAARWLIEHAATEFGCERLLIGGESAGAHLSALTLLRLRDQHNYRGFLAANLQFGAFDLTLTPSARRWGGRNLILNTPLIEWFVECLVPSVAERSDPAVSPLYADLAGLPPALFTVGTLDPLLDDSLFMHSRWLAAGNRSSLALYPGGIHGFNFFPTALGQQANQRCLEFLRASIDGAEAGDGG